MINVCHSPATVTAAPALPAPLPEVVRTETAAGGPVVTFTGAQLETTPVRDDLRGGIDGKGW